MDNRVIELHVDLSRHYDGVVDGIRSMVARGNSGTELDNPKDRAVVQRRSDCTLSLVSVPCVDYRKRFGGPDHTSRSSRPARGEILRDFVDLNDRLPVRIMTRNHASKLKRHVRILRKIRPFEFTQMLAPIRI